MMLPSVNIRLSFKILVLLFVCATLLPSVESKPKTEVESNDPGSESPKEKPSNAVSPLVTESYNSSKADPSQPLARKPSTSKPKTKPKRKGKGKKGKGKKKLKPSMVKKPEQVMAETTKNPEEPSTENWSKSSETSKKPEELSTENWSKSSGTSIRPEEHSTENWSKSSEPSKKPEEPSTENWSKSSETSKKSEEPSTESWSKYSETSKIPEEPSTENWSKSSETSQKSEEPSTESWSKYSETSKIPEEPSTENWSKSSGTSIRPEEHSTENWSKSSETSKNPEEPSTENWSKSSETSQKSEEPSTESWSKSSETSKIPEEPSTENWSMSSEKSEKSEMEENPEKSSTEPGTELSVSSEKSEKPEIEDKTEKSCIKEMDREFECRKWIKGPIAPVFTPFGDDGEIDYSVIPEYMKHLKDTGVAAIVVGGTSGEALSMSPCERKHLFSHWIPEANKYDIPVIAQVGGTDVPSVLDMARHAQEVGACGLLLLPQLFYKPKCTEELVSYMKTVSEHAWNLPIIYYDFPMMTGVTVNMTELIILATKHIRNFKGVKSDLKTIFEAGDLLQDDQQIFLGNHQMASAVLMGHESSIATVNNMFLDLVYEIIEAVQSGDVEKARYLQKKLNKIVSELAEIGDFQATMKTAFGMITGIKVGHVRTPQYPLPEEKRRRVCEVIKKNGFKVKDE